MPNNSTITLPGYTDLDLPENPGYTFAGWNTQADGSGTTFKTG
ncbi:MAG: InlB B-repeat-containing protein [Oscillospiraceae bacterium]